MSSTKTVVSPRTDKSVLHGEDRPSGAVPSSPAQNKSQESCNEVYIVDNPHSTGVPLTHKPAVIETLQAPSQKRPSSVASGEAPSRKRRVSTDSDAALASIPQEKLMANPIVKCISKPGKFTKKPQMKYDPDIPMTKEEAAIWRREQRRKRNRESASASRQRQRDRITELETEVDQWKVKYDQIMHQLCELEQMTGVILPSRQGSSRVIHRHATSSPSLTARDIYHHHHHHRPPQHPSLNHQHQASLRTDPSKRCSHHGSPVVSGAFHNRTSVYATPPPISHATITAFGPPAASKYDRGDLSMYYLPHEHQHHGPNTVSPYSRPPSPPIPGSDEDIEETAPNGSKGADGEQDEFNDDSESPSSRNAYHHQQQKPQSAADSSAVSSEKAAGKAAGKGDRNDDDGDALFPPDLCISEPAKLEQMDQELLEEAAGHVLSATATEAIEHEDFGEFLLNDGADCWL